MNSSVYVCLSCMRRISLTEVWQVQEPDRSAPTYTHRTADGHPVVRIDDGLRPTDAGGGEELRALVREWQIARRPSHLPAPGVDVVETYRHAVLRMTVVDEALARFDLDGPAGGAMVGQPAPTESTGPFTDEYAVETLTHLARTLPEIDQQHSCLRGALAIKAIAARAHGVGRAVSKTVCASCGAADFYTCGCYDHCSCGHDRRSHTASGICTRLGCGCHSGLHGRAEISPAPPPAPVPETPDACENCGTVFDDTTRKFITWDDIDLCERCHQETPESQRREESES